MCWGFIRIKKAKPEEHLNLEVYRWAKRIFDEGKAKGLKLLKSVIQTKSGSRVSVDDGSWLAPLGSTTILPLPMI